MGGRYQTLLSDSCLDWDEEGPKIRQSSEWLMKREERRGNRGGQAEGSKHPRLFFRLLHRSCTSRLLAGRLNCVKKWKKNYICKLTYKNVHPCEVWQSSVFDVDTSCIICICFLSATYLVSKEIKYDHREFFCYITMEMLTILPPLSVFNSTSSSVSMLLL